MSLVRLHHGFKISAPRHQREQMSGTHTNLFCTASSASLLISVTTWLTPWSRVLLDKLTVTQLVTKFPAFYGARWFITVFTRACHWSLSCSRWIRPKTSHHISLRTSPFPSKPRSSEWSLPFRVSDQSLVRISHLSHVCYISYPSHSPWFDHARKMRFLTRHNKSFTILLERLDAPKSVIPGSNQVQVPGLRSLFTCRCESRNGWLVSFS
jgi:hypothetical protein